MYSAANETRYANDVSGVLSQLDGSGWPDTVARAFFQPTRLLPLQTRNGAAYKGLMALAESAMGKQIAAPTPPRAPVRAELMIGGNAGGTV